MEFVLGGIAAAAASIFTNPLEVLKHHIELEKKIRYSDKGRNFLQIGYKVAKRNGLKSFQSGLSPALAYHFVSYGMKLGTYHYGYKNGITVDQNGKTVVSNSILASVLGGVMGQYFSNPIYLIKTQTEMNAIEHKKKEGYVNTIQRIYRDTGVRGFFRGATTSMPRAFIGTSQLTSFAVAKEKLANYEVFRQNRRMTTLLASSLAATVFTMAMTPFDMVLTKLYKQAIKGKPKTEHSYDNFLDCVRKTYIKEGLKPFYRGFGPLSVKLGPHTVFCLVLWDEIKGIYDDATVSYQEYVPKIDFYQQNFTQLMNEEPSNLSNWS